MITGMVKNLEYIPLTSPLKTEIWTVGIIRGPECISCTSIQPAAAADPTP
jgi:hypothetical protein